ncbi:MAG: hypothetical protein SVR08_06345 [Spirochaetota bacterium]|nr:hypothetical protein [Spirochaetota bacterium]
MFKRPIILMIFITSILGYSIGKENLNKNIINNLKLNKTDIPEDFVYGRIPDFANKVLMGNPWMMDKIAIKKLSNRIYPDGDYRKIANIHVTIMTRKEEPYGDDIVCYIIIYKNKMSANVEIKKIYDFAGFNRDRIIVLSKDNIVVFLHVDDVENYHLIRKMSLKMKKKLSEF